MASELRFESDVERRLEPVLDPGTLLGGRVARDAHQRDLELFGGIVDYRVPIDVHFRLFGVDPARTAVSDRVNRADQRQ